MSRRVRRGPRRWLGRTPPLHVLEAGTASSRDCRRRPPYGRRSLDWGRARSGLRASSCSRYRSGCGTTPRRSVPTWRWPAGSMRRSRTATTPGLRSAATTPRGCQARVGRSGNSRSQSQAHRCRRRWWAGSPRTWTMVPVTVTAALHASPGTVGTVGTTNGSCPRHPRPEAHRALRRRRMHRRETSRRGG
jgi:hypothetical protein